MRKLKSLLILGIALTLMGATKCSHQEQQGQSQGSENVSSEDFKIEDIKVGTGKMPAAGDTIFVHYTGWLTNGTKFDSSKDRGQPFSFKLGAGQVIKGWDKGFAGMKEGGVRKLTIPYSMAYGESGRPPVIPPKATLIFEVELLEVKGK